MAQTENTLTHDQEGRYVTMGLSKGVVLPRRSKKNQYSIGSLFLEKDRPRTALEELKFATGLGHTTLKAGSEKKIERVKSYPWSMGCGPWCRKFFWEGKGSGEQEHDVLFDNEFMVASKLMNEYRRFVGLITPALIVHFFWWSLMIKHDLWYLFPERYILVITMVFASFLAGLTSIGGGTIAFPVLTLILNVSPAMARDFSLLIQSFGMTSATFTIMFMGVKIEWHAILLGTFGGAIGLITGLELIEKHMTPGLKKMVFASFWFSFAFALFLLNRYRKRRTYPRIMIFNWWKGLILVITGIVGGVFTSFVGSGLDICTLSVLTLFFRVSEKQATPTSVIVMAVNSLLGLFWRQAIQTDVDIETWKYVAVCAVVVVIGAPLGSLVGTHLHRLVLAFIIYIIVGVTLITSFVLVPQTPTLIAVSIIVIILGGVVFLSLTLVGQRVLSREINGMLQREKESVNDNGVDLVLDEDQSVTANGSDPSQGNSKGYVIKGFVPEVTIISRI